MLEDASAVMTQLPPEHGGGSLARIAAGDALPSFRVQVCGRPNSSPCSAVHTLRLVKALKVRLHADSGKLAQETDNTDMSWVYKY